MKKYSFPFCFLIFGLVMLAGCVSDASNDSGDPDLKPGDVVIAEETDTTGQAAAEAEALALAEAAEKARQDSIAVAEKAAKEKLADNKPKPTTPKPKPSPKPKANNSGPKVTWDKKSYNFGTVTEGKMVKHDFIFKNTGTADVVIKDAQASCGCTVPGFSFFPVEPGEEGVISVSFNSANKAGAQRPTVTIYTNGYPAKHTLYLEGVVQSKPAGAETSSSTNGPKETPNDGEE